MSLIALNVAVLVVNLYLFYRARQRMRALKSVSSDFTRRIMSGHVVVVGADTGRIGRLCVAPVGDDGLCLSIDPTPNGWNLCGRCFEEGPLVPAPCDEHPELLQSAAIGMYHCPDCGAMLLAGYPHPQVCPRCANRRHPNFDAPAVH